jgi:hypothetical protein
MNPESTTTTTTTTTPATARTARRMQCHEVIAIHTRLLAPDAIDLLTANTDAAAAAAAQLSTELGFTIPVSVIATFRRDKGILKRHKPAPAPSANWDAVSELTPLRERISTLEIKVSELEVQLRGCTAPGTLGI